MLKSGFVDDEKADVEVSGDKFTLCVDPGKATSIFSQLVPLEAWVGKEVECVIPLEGSRISCGPGWPTFNDEHDVLLLLFKDGTKSALFSEGPLLTGSFEKRQVPDMTLLVRAGILSLKDDDDRNKETQLKRELHDRLKNLSTERRTKQKMLLGVGRKEHKNLYQQIIDIEKEITEKQAKVDGKWKWADYVFNCETIFNFVPGMVDILAWKERNSGDARRSYLKTDGLLPSEGRKIAAIHPIFEAIEGGDTANLYSLEFEGRLFSLPFGLSEGQNLELSMEGLLGADLIQNHDLQRIRNDVRRYRAERETAKVDAERVNILYNELDEFGISEKRTRQILEELAELEAKEKSPKPKPTGGPNRGGFVCA